MAPFRPVASLTDLPAGCRVWSRESVWFFAFELQVKDVAAGYVGFVGFGDSTNLICIMAALLLSRKSAISA